MVRNTLFRIPADLWYLCQWKHLIVFVTLFYSSSQLLNKITLSLQVSKSSIQHVSFSGPSTTTNWRHRSYFGGKEWIDHREHQSIIPASSPSRMECTYNEMHILCHHYHVTAVVAVPVYRFAMRFLVRLKLWHFKGNQTCRQEALTVEERESNKLPLYWKIKSRGTTIFNNIWVWRKLIYTNTILFFLKNEWTLWCGRNPIMFHVISVFDLLSVELISFH